MNLSIPKYVVFESMPLAMLKKVLALGIIVNTAIVLFVVRPHLKQMSITDAISVSLYAGSFPQHDLVATSQSVWCLLPGRYDFGQGTNKPVRTEECRLTCDSDENVSVAGTTCAHSSEFYVKEGIGQILFTTRRQVHRGAGLSSSRHAYFLPEADVMNIQLHFNMHADIPLFQFPYLFGQQTQHVSYHSDSEGGQFRITTFLLDSFGNINRSVEIGRDVDLSIQDVLWLGGNAQYLENTYGNVDGYMLRRIRGG